MCDMSGPFDRSIWLLTGCDLFACTIQKFGFGSLTHWAGLFNPTFLTKISNPILLKGKQIPILLNRLEGITSVQSLDADEVESVPSSSVL